MATPRVLAAGGVVYREGFGNTGPQFLLVHRNRYHDWSLPKGKLDRGESFEEAAAREVREETGIKCNVGPFLGGVTYPTQRGRPKLVKYWMLEAVKGSFVPNLEVDNAEWVGINGAKALLTYNRDARLIERAQGLLENPSSARLYVVRNGNAGVRSKAKGPDKKRPLTGKGREQANQLAEFMARHPVSKIVSSPALRCVQTVEPLAAQLGIDVETSKKLKENMTADDIRKYLKSIGSGAVVLATHENWVRSLIRDLDSRKVPLRGSRKWPRASIWVLDLFDGKARAGYYAGKGVIPSTEL
ncbi:MAG: NUDIX hydrolase [Acidimicrobiia bacterium]|nr:NUDIX hydrolase [Acidimicrobiia bacterium]